MWKEKKKEKAKEKEREKEKEKKEKGKRKRKEGGGVVGRWGKKKGKREERLLLFLVLRGSFELLCVAVSRCFLIFIYLLFFCF